MRNLWTRRTAGRVWSTARSWRVGAAVVACGMIISFLALVWPLTALAHATAPGTTEYVDAKLGFGLSVPQTWDAQPQPGLRPAATTTSVSLIDPQDEGHPINVSIYRGADMVASFTARGAPNARIGQYPAFTDVTPADQSQPGASCLEETLRASSDIVVAQWCADDTSRRRGQLDTILASYTPTALISAFTLLHGLAARQDTHPTSCAELVARMNSKPDAANWGKTLAGPSDTRWNRSSAPAVSVCSNTYFVNGAAASWPGYYFQCTELANRYVSEQWGHGSINGNAATYFDYVDSAGARHPGTARVFPDARLSSDATQGGSAFSPGPGDLLVFQDVNDAQDWTSGLRPGSVGHVAVVTGADATHVYMMQQNFSDTLYYMALPMTRMANGWHITDSVSGVAGRIVRGWIHFTSNTAQSPSSPANTANPGGVNTQDIYALGTDGELYTYQWQSATGWSPASNLRASITQNTPTLARFVGAPALTTYDLPTGPGRSVFLLGEDGHLYEYWRRATDGWHRDDITSASTASPPPGVTFTGPPAVVSYVAPGDTRLRHSVFVMGNNHHLYNYSWIFNGGWSGPVDVSGALADRLTGAPSAVTWAQSEGQYQAAYSTSEDGRLYEFRAKVGGSWVMSDVTGAVALALPNDTQFTGATSAYTYVSPDGAARGHNVYALGNDGHLYAFVWAPDATAAGTWTGVDISHESATSTGATIAASVATASAATPDATATGAPTTTPTAADTVRLMSAPSAHYASATGGGAHEVYVTGSDGHIYEFYSVTGWRMVDISAQGKQPATASIIGPPVSFSYALDSDAGLRHGVFAVTMDGRLAELSWVQSANGAWTFADHGSPDGVSLGGGTLTGVASAT